MNDRLIRLEIDRARRREKALARLSKLPANSGHAKVLRGKLGISTYPEPVDIPKKELKNKNKSKKRKKKKSKSGK